MKTKALAILAVLAMVFAGTAVLAEENDVDAADPQIVVPTVLKIGRTALVTFTLEEPAAGTEVTWSVTGTLNTAVTIAGTDSATKSTTNAQGIAYATITGAVEGSCTITATVDTTGTESSAITVSALATEQISTWGKDDTSAMYAFAYTDMAILIDTKYMTNMTGVDDVVVSIKNADAAAATIIGPISAHERIWIDGTEHLTDGKKTTIILKAYGVDAALGTVEITPADVDTAASILNIDSNRIDITPLAPDSYNNLVRNEVFDLSTPASASLMCDTYTLTGFAATTAHKTVKNSDGTITEGTDDIPLESFKIEDLLMLASQKGATPSSDAITIYANWAKTYYTITFKDATADQIVSVTDAAGVEIAKTSPVAANVAVISGSTVIGSDSGSYGIISIAKKAANIGAEYTYKIFVTDSEQTTDISTANYKISMVNNGTWKITDVKENLWISAIAIPTALETGADFEVNYLKNDGTNDAEARIALDLEDFPATAGMTLSMKGTYYRLIDTNVRAYGNIENLSTMTTYNDNTNIREYTGYIDKVQVPAPTESTFGTDTVHTGVLTTTAEGHAYDLVLKTKADQKYMLYSIQGVWDTNGATEGGLLYTPWALYEVA
ncbi:MAG: Ig-like domain-containing protein [Candidatus Methanomethylophilaceae archaeon]|nr:Ig-like domain-containing protein [Candidatus Methanomethylophilaceae archaeon]